MDMTLDPILNAIPKGGSCLTISIGFSARAGAKQVGLEGCGVDIVQAGYFFGISLSSQPAWEALRVEKLRNRTGLIVLENSSGCRPKRGGSNWVKMEWM